MTEFTHDDIERIVAAVEKCVRVKLLELMGDLQSLPLAEAKEIYRKAYRKARDRCVEPPETSVHERLDIMQRQIDALKERVSEISVDFDKAG